MKNDEPSPFRQRPDITPPQDAARASTNPSPQPNTPPEQQPQPDLSAITLNEPAATTTGLSSEPGKRRSRKKLVLGILLGIILAAGIVAATGWFWYNQQLSAVKPGSDEMVRVTVEAGSDPAAIGSLLKENGLIRSELAFGWYVRSEQKAGLLQAGTYRLGKGEDVPKIVKHLTSGNTDTFSLTFLPGATLADHRKVLIDAGYDPEKVDAALAKTYDGPLFAGKPAGTDLEGYIYGETYTFAADATPEDILQYIFDYYEQVVKDENLAALYKKHGFTLYQGITLASIIQREVATPEDAAQVAQVFELRLKKDMVLGSDVTYQYIADKTGQERDVNLDSPYNTRRYKGLPPGPISSPGIDSLKAVGSPASGDYLYFLSGDDDKTYFAHTYEEHEQNIKNHCQKKCQII